MPYHCKQCGDYYYYDHQCRTRLVLTINPVNNPIYTTQQIMVTPHYNSLNVNQYYGAPQYHSQYHSLYHTPHHSTYSTLSTNSMSLQNSTSYPRQGTSEYETARRNFGASTNYGGDPNYTPGFNNRGCYDLNFYNF